MTNEDMEKLLNELKELLSPDEEHQEDIEMAKKAIKENLDKNPRAIIYVSNYGTLTAGRINELLALIAMIFDSLVQDEDITTEMLTTAFMAGMTGLKEDKKSRQTINDILEQMKKFI